MSLACTDYSVHTKQQRFEADRLHLMCSTGHKGHLLNMANLYRNMKEIQEFKYMRSAKDVSHI